MNLSIIIPTLNEEKNIGNILSDISKQDFSKDHIEVLVADAGSTDNTKKIAMDHGAKIISGGYPGVARNNGAKQAKGDIIYFIDADIRIGKRFLTDSYIEFVSRRLDVAGMDNHPIYTDEDTWSNKIMISAINNLANIILRTSEYTKKPKAAATCMLFNKKSFLEVGGFDEKIYWGEDSEIIQRMHNSGYKFGMLKNSSIFTRPRKVIEHGIWNYYTNVIKLNHYRDNHGEITSKKKYQEITGIDDYFKLNSNDAKTL